MNKLNSYYSNENSKLFDFFNETNKATFYPFVLYVFDNYRIENLIQPLKINA
jgi:hypothetical protein